MIFDTGPNVPWIARILALFCLKHKYFRSRSTSVGKGKATKRKADEIDTSITETDEKTDNQPKKAKTEITPSTDQTAPTSRSGRLIKPKKFVDDDLNSSKTVSCKQWLLLKLF